MPDSIVISPDRQELYDNNDEYLDTIFKGAEVILMAILDVAAANDITLPTNQLVYIGQVPADCEHVSVSVSTAGFGRPGDPMGGPTDCWAPHRATYTAEIARCVPKDNQVRSPGRYASGVVELPSSVAMEDHARTLMRDMKLLLESAAVASNFPFEDAGSEANVLVLDPENGFQTVSMSITIGV